MKEPLKTQELKNFSYFGISHIGNIRSENEDVYDYFDSVNGSVFIVCDGMGGIKGGKTAAETAVNEMKLCFTQEWYEDPKDLLTEAIVRANTKIYEKFVGETLKPGTTAVLVLLRQNMIWYAHAGDSRLYYYTGKKLFQLTKDHSYVTQLVDKKLLSEEDALTHPRRNEITKALGIHKFIDPSICKHPLEPSDNDHLLLCSDGLVNELANKEISEILLEDLKTKEKVERLLSEALEHGGVDNVTIQLITFYNTGKEENTEFIKNRSTTNSKKKLKIITFIFSLIIILTIGFFIRELFTEEKVINQKKSYKSGLAVYKSNVSDTLIELFISNELEPKNILKRYHAELNEIGYVSGKSNATEYSKFYIPVKGINTFRTGSNVYSIPGIRKDNIIDIMIINNKNEFYFFPGEIFVIPKDKND